MMITFLISLSEAFRLTPKISYNLLSAIFLNKEREMTERRRRKQNDNSTEKTLTKTKF